MKRPMHMSHVYGTDAMLLFGPSNVRVISIMINKIKRQTSEA